MPLGVSVLLVVLVVTGAFAVVRKRTDGRVRTVAGVSKPAAATDDRTTVSAAEIGTELGAAATLVQFSSAFCAPCRAARVLLTKAVEGRDGVAYVDVDAESHLDLVRRLDVLRTPTVLVFDAAGSVVGRASGVPRAAEVEAVLNAVASSDVSDNG